MANVSQILRAKAEQQLHTITPGATVFEAIRLMAEKNIGALPVVSDGRTVGLISERDYARKVELADRAARLVTVGEIIDPQVLYVLPSHSCEECMALMTQKRVRHLPVIDGGKLVGLVSIGDVVKTALSEQHFIIEQLEHYIAGNRGW